MSGRCCAPGQRWWKASAIYGSRPASVTLSVLRWEKGQQRGWGCLRGLLHGNGVVQPRAGRAVGLGCADGAAVTWGGGKRVLLRAAWHPHLGQYRKPPAEEKLSCPELWGHHTPPKCVRCFIARNERSRTCPISRAITAHSGEATCQLQARAQPGRKAHLPSTREMLNSEFRPLLCTILSQPLQSRDRYKHRLYVQTTVQAKQR